MHLLDPAPFGRILPAMVTPMKADGAVDFEAAQQLARQLVADGADGLVVNGTTGESPTTHMEEKVELVQAVKEVVDVPIICAGTGDDFAPAGTGPYVYREMGRNAVLEVFREYRDADAAETRSLYLREYAEAIGRVAAEKGCVFVDANLNEKPVTALDGIHPDKAGMMTLAGEILKARGIL